MLVLTRKEDQKIHIGNDISIMVVKTQDGSVRLGIEAPKGVAVDREEICARKHGRMTNRTYGIHVTGRDIRGIDED